MLLNMLIAFISICIYYADAIFPDSYKWFIIILCCFPFVALFLVSEIKDNSRFNTIEFAIGMYLLEAVFSGILTYKLYEKTSLLCAAIVITAMIIEILVAVIVFIKCSISKPYISSNISYMNDDDE